MRGFFASRQRPRSTPVQDAPAATPPQHQAPASSVETTKWWGLNDPPQQLACAMMMCDATLTERALARLTTEQWSERAPPSGGMLCAGEGKTPRAHVHTCDSRYAVAATLVASAPRSWINQLCKEMCADCRVAVTLLLLGEG